MQDEQTLRPWSRDTLLFPFAAIAVWAVHFMLCYVTAAIWCAKFAATDAFGELRVLIAIYTVIALAIVAWFGVRAWRKHRFGDTSLPHDDNTPGDRHRFLGFATLLLCGLSFIAITYTALPAVFIGSCA